MEQRYSNALYLFKDSREIVFGDATVRIDDTNVVTFCQKAFDIQQSGLTLKDIVVRGDSPIEVVNETSAKIEFIANRDSFRKIGPSEQYFS